MLVKEILSSVKANRYTYFNLTKESIKDFQKLYAYLQRNRHREIGLSAIEAFNKILKEDETDFLKKYKAMKIISTSLKHKL